MKTLLHSRIPLMALSLLLATVALPAIADTGAAQNKFQYRIPFKKSLITPGEPPFVADALYTSDVLFTTGLTAPDSNSSTTHCLRHGTPEMTSSPRVLTIQGVPLKVFAAWLGSAGQFCVAAGEFPSLSPGKYELTLVTGTGVTVKGSIWYVSEAKAGPTVSSFNPPMGSTRGYAQVEIHGTGFVPGAQAMDHQAGSWPIKTTFINSSKLLVEVPPNNTLGRTPTPGEVNYHTISVSNPGSINSDYYERNNVYYTYEGLELSGMTPSNPKAGDLVKLTGAGLFKTLVIKIGNTVIPLDSFEDAKPAGGGWPGNAQFFGSGVFFRMPALAPGSYALTAKIPEFDAATYQYPIVVAAPE